MSSYEWQKINDESFEEILENSVDAPSGSIVSEVTPWKKSMNRVLTGIALKTITLNFYYLNYILPTVGTIIKLLGFRTLKHDNKWFNACYVISAILAIFNFSALIINTTIAQSTFNDSSASTVLTFICFTLSLAEYFCLWRGILAVQRKAQLPARAGGAVAFIVFSFIIFLLFLMEFEGFIIPIGLLIGYIFIIRNLSKLSKELYEAGYVIRTKPIKITNRCFVLGIVSILIVGFTCGYIFGNGYPMKWTPVNNSETADILKIKSDLASLGFPENVLDDISQEDIAACNGAVQVIVKESDRKVSYGMTAVLESLVNQSSVNSSQSCNLYFTSVGVKISGEENLWIMFHHFLWDTNPAFYGTEALQIWPAYQNGYYSPAGEATGHVLYDKGGATFTSDYDFLGTKSYTSESIFFGSQNRSDIFASFSMPRDGERPRGYVAYPMYDLQTGYLLVSSCNYVHQRSPLSYPAVTAMEQRTRSLINYDGAFITFQEQFTFHPEDIITEQD